MMLATPTQTQETYETTAAIAAETLVVKIGGSAGVDLERCADDLAVLARQRPVIVVHGVSAAMDALCAARGVPVRTITSPTGHVSRYTDLQTRALFVEASAAVNRDLVDRLRARGIEATGFVEELAIWGERKAALRALVDGRLRMIRDDYSGTIAGVDADRLRAALAAGQMVVLPPLAASADGPLNIDGDRASAAVAAAVGARELVILSNVRGLYRNPADEVSLVRSVTLDALPQALEWSQGRMKRKVLGAAEALEGGVQRVIIADGRLDQPVRRALAGHGTEFIR